MAAMILLALIGIVCMLSFKLFIRHRDAESGEPPVIIYILIAFIIILFLIWVAFMIFDVGESMRIL
ncbi:MAG: hypothetical protein EA390_00325 [Balneolaceae bacterium]|nr:MAG: hypothetical protein EA390_00325 [Balneolaceae bacterium]